MGIGEWGLGIGEVMGGADGWIVRVRVGESESESESESSGEGCTRRQVKLAGEKHI